MEVGARPQRPHCLAAEADPVVQVGDFYHSTACRHPRLCSNDCHFPLAVRSGKPTERTDFLQGGEEGIVSLDGIGRIFGCVLVTRFAQCFQPQLAVAVVGIDKPVLGCRAPSPGKRPRPTHGVSCVPPAVTPDPIQPHVHPGYCFPCLACNEVTFEAAMGLKAPTSTEP